MRLKTLGGLELEGSDLKRPQPLLLLAYLALEGPKDRQFLSELFWWGASDPRNNLSSTLTRIRSYATDLVEADTKRVWVNLRIDVKDLLEHLERSEISEAQAIYKGTFLSGYSDEDLGEELSEWVYTYRDYLSARFREALLTEATKQKQQEKLELAANFADQAFLLESAAELEPEDYQRIYSYLKLASHPRAKEVLKAAEEIGLKLTSFKSQKAKTPAKDIPNNLFANKTNFIGRDQELIDIAAYLGRPDCQLLTLHGMGGIGKTRLAHQAAQDQLKQGHFDKGIYFIPLENIGNNNLLFPTIANAIKLELQAEQDIYQQLTWHIADKNMLFVLDNFEHLVEAAPDISKFLLECNNLKLVITSREILNIEEEWVKPVEGMRYPDVKQSLEESKYFEAINLFVQRAKKTYSAFELSQENLPHLVTLCELTQGLPLALELAAAWVKIMTIEEISKEVQANLKILESSRRNQLERHNSIEAVFNYSWNQLNRAEQMALAKFSVFEGGFTRIAASQVCGTTLLTLLALVNKSLITIQGNERFVMHPLVHGYARAHLFVQKDIVASTETSHAIYFLDLARSLDYWGKNSIEAMAIIGRELPNIKMAMFWAAKNDKADLLEGLEDIVVYFDRNFYIDIGINFFESAIEKAKSQNIKLRAFNGKMQINISWLQFRSGQFEEAKLSALKTLKKIVDLNEFSIEMKAYNIIGWSFFRSASYANALENFKKALDKAIILEDNQRQAMYLSNLGAAYAELGRYSEAEFYYKDSIEKHLFLGATFGLIPVYSNLGKLYYDQAQYHTAIFILLKAEKIALNTKSQSQIAIIQSLVAENYYKLDEYNLAEKIAKEAFLKLPVKYESDIRISLLNLLGRIAQKNSDFMKSSIYYLESIEEAIETENKVKLMECLNILSQFFYQLQKYCESNTIVRYLAKNIDWLQRTERMEINQLIVKLETNKCEEPYEESDAEVNQLASDSQIFALSLKTLKGLVTEFTDLKVHSL